jgi:hypothetical protein
MKPLVNKRLYLFHHKKIRWGSFIALICLVFALAMISSTLYGVYRSYSPILFMDHWWIVKDYAAVAAGKLSLDILFQQHNEHRILFPRLLMFADFKFTEGSNLLNLTAIFIMQGLHALLLGVLISQLMGFTGWRRWAVLGCVFGVMFSALQMVNLNKGFQNSFIGVFLFATSAFWMLSTASGRCNKSFRVTCIAWLVFSLVVGVICTFTLANGVLVWPLLLLVAWTRRAPYIVLGLVLVVGIAADMLYFQDYYSPPGHTNPLEALKKPGILFSYVAYYLSIPFQGPSRDIALILGKVGFIAAVVLGCRAVLLPSTLKSTAESVLLATSLFVILTACVTALGRVDFGLNQALSPRYATPSLIFWVALFGLALFYSFRAKGQYGKLPMATVLVLIIILSGAIAAQQCSAIGAWRGAKLHLDRAVTALLVGVSDTEAISAALPQTTIIEAQAKTLRELGLAPFHNQLAQLPGSLLQQHYKIADQDSCLGWFDAVNPIPGRQGVRVRGWAWDQTATTNARLIVIVDKDNVIQGLALSGWNRPDVPKKVNPVQHIEVGWEGHARSGSQPLNAFAILADGVSACRLQGQGRLKK